MHTAVWPKDYQKEQWKNDRVAVIGSGASSIQTVPTMQPHAKHIDVFVRTAVWFVQIANNYGQNKEYDDKEKAEFKKDPKALVAHSKDIEDQVVSNSQVMMSSLRSPLILLNAIRTACGELSTKVVRHKRWVKRCSETAWRSSSRTRGC